jgi:hypothetical protein
LEELVEEDDDEGGDDELDDEQEADTGAEFFGWTVETCEDYSILLLAFEMREKGRERTLLGTAEQNSVILQAEIDVDEVGTRQQLHDHSGGDDRRDTELHECSSIWGEDDTHPVERVGGVGGHDTVEWYLGAYQENKEGDGCPEHFLVERDLEKRWELGKKGWRGTRRLTLRSGEETSGRMGRKGLTRLRNRTIPDWISFSFQ